MIIKRKWEDVAIKENKHHLDAREIYHDVHAQIMHLNMKPGEALVPHKTPVDVVFYVLEGCGTVYIGDEHIEVERDTLVESPVNITHYWKNTGKENLRIMVLKIPSPLKATPVL
ncbi:MAG: cupin domain-containing protein [Candidatus Marinimicrobia bacterium]|jgi:mannose-6-phosphate isomerase-like protein (cupin superfamily)|nr:cupin domain-containing protein [Candidatus Neomarinimicrobiota bacterium]MDD4961243.1 cupin domain-containing protein [Candidatus Neomarinimicrobiota bacterium]MDD5710473.1 cupin domain-containing protein [Candidatus Neomarinimicrobiota bacterium]MDX9778292.1 cupin domain-containing protein [bacterium]